MAESEKQEKMPQTETPKVEKEEKTKARKKKSKTEVEVDKTKAPDVKAEKTPEKVEKAGEKETKASIPDYRKNLKLFGRWSFDVEVKDPGLKPYINLTPVYTPYTAGRTIKKQFWKSKKNIVERLVGKLMVPGHKGKKHYWSSKRLPGMLPTQWNIVLKAFEIVERKTNKNPIEVLVRAIEASAPCEGITTIEYGGVRYPKAADMAPQRRIDLALRWIVQGAFLASRKNKSHMAEALAEELIATAAHDPKANGLAKKAELERQAAGSR